MIAARQLHDDTTVFAGVGVPLLAAALAKQRHAPRLTMVIEGGIIGPQIAPGRLPVSTNEMRAGHRATMLPGITDAFLFAQRGFVDVGFMGGAQIDQYGNINTSVLGPDYWQPKVRLPGTGGANDIASLCREVIIVTAHEKRRFVPRVDFVTSPGWLRGDGSRRAAGLLLRRRLARRHHARHARLRPGQQAHADRGDASRRHRPTPCARTPAFRCSRRRGSRSPSRPSDDELAMLRALDPERRFLGT